MSNMNQLEQQINALQINNGDGEVRKITKKVGPTVPPKPKKSQPEVISSFLLNSIR